MLSIQIPKAFLPGFQAIASMSTEQTNEIVAFLQQVPVGTGSINFGRTFDANFAEYSGTDLSDAIYSLASFSTFSPRIEGNMDLVEALTNSFVVQTNTADDNVTVRLKNNLKTIPKFGYNCHSYT